MIYNHVYFQVKYLNLLKKDKIPLLVTNDECYDLGIQAVKNLRFEKDGIHFEASFRGHVKKVAVFKDDVNELIEYRG